MTNTPIPTDPAALKAWLSAVDRAFDKVMRRATAWYLPLALVLLSLTAWWWWPGTSETAPLATQVRAQVLAPQIEWTPATAALRLSELAPAPTWHNPAASSNTWALFDAPAAAPAGALMQIHGHGIDTAQCWNARSGKPLEAAPSLSPSDPQAWSMEPQASSVLCKLTTTAALDLRAEVWSPAALAARSQSASRNAGLLDGGMVVLAALLLLLGWLRRNPSLPLLAAWLVLGARLMSEALGLGGWWMGQALPPSWPNTLTPLTQALFAVVTMAWFLSLFDADLKRHGPIFSGALLRLNAALLLPAAALLPNQRFASVLSLSVAVALIVMGWGLTPLVRRNRFWSTALFAVAVLGAFAALWFAQVGLALAAALSACLCVVLSEGTGVPVKMPVTAGDASFHTPVAGVEAQPMPQPVVAATARSSTEAAIPVPTSTATPSSTAEPDEPPSSQPPLSLLPGAGRFRLDMHGRFLSAAPDVQELLGGRIYELGRDLWSDHFGQAQWMALARHTFAGELYETEVTSLSQQHVSRCLKLRAVLENGHIEGTLLDIHAAAKPSQKPNTQDDPLTQVLNRRGIETVLGECMLSLPKGRPMAVAYLDLDRFKLINDLYGHAAGDEVLEQVCERIRRLLGTGMHLGRVGGDEFLLVFGNTQLKRAETLCREILGNLCNSHYRVEERAFTVRASMGLLEVTRGASIKDVVSTADRACREAKLKHDGLVVYDRNSTVFNEHEAELQLVERLSTGRPIDGLFLEMQPIMSLRKPFENLNFEVLLRLQDEKGQRVPTDRLIRAGENAGRMGVIDRWVLASTLEWMRKNETQLRHNQFVCMNLSGASLNDDRFREDVYGMLDHNRDLAPRLCLEITESVALHDTSNTRRFIDRLASYGTKVALDDFGAGYTSFSYLKDLPAEVLKIDGSFIVNMNKNPANVAIVEAIVSLAQNLGMKTIAEWAEDFQTVETLAQIGVDYVQGFIVARPQTPSILLSAKSSADFIADEALNTYLGTLALSDDEMGHVDLILGGDLPPSNTPLQ